MADAAPAPSLADSTDEALRQRVETAVKEQTKKRLEIETKEIGELERIRKEDTAAAQKALAQEGASIEEMKGLKGQMPSPGQFATPLWQQFGSPGFILSQIASAFTRYPMVSALQSGGAALKAINEGDMARYEQAFDAWKANADLTIKRMNMEHQEYQDISTQHAQNLDDWVAHVRVMAAKNGDAQMAALMDAGFFPQVDELWDKRYHSMIEMDNAKTQLTQNDDLRKEWKRRVDAGENPFQVLKELEEAKRPILGRYGTLTTQDIPKIKADLEDTLGHPLDSALSTAVDSAYGSKGANASRIAAATNRAIEQIKEDIAAGKKEEEIKPAERINEAILAGSSPAGRSAATAFINQYRIEHPNAKSDEIQRASAIYTQTLASARTLGTRQSNVDVAVVEAKNIAKLAIDASNKIPRTDFVPVNEIRRRIARGTSTPEQQTFDTYNTGLITAYAATMSRTGQTTVEAQKRAQDILSTATGPQAYEKGVEALIREMEVVQSAVREVETRQEGETPKVQKWERRPDGSLGLVQ